MLFDIKTLLQGYRNHVKITSKINREVTNGASNRQSPWCKHGADFKVPQKHFLARWFFAFPTYFVMKILPMFSIAV